MIWRVFFVTLSRLLLLNPANAAKPSPAAIEAGEKFALKLSTSAGLEASQENVILSPLLIHAAMTLLYYGSADETTLALKNALNFRSFEHKQAAVKNMADLLSSTKSKARGQAYLASGIYAQDRFTYDFKADFKQVAQHFDIVTQLLNFGKDLKALDEINYWFLTKTNFTIGGILSAQALHENLHFMLVSAVAFKAPWLKAFDYKETEKLNFHSDAVTHKLVESMFVTHRFRYGEFDELDAKAVELPYNNSDMKMLIIYPNKVDGLSALEEKLKCEDLSALSRQIEERRLALTLPKFHIEYNIELKSALSQLGLTKIFDSSAKFSNMFSSILSALTPFVTNVQHKAVLSVDEVGGEIEAGFAFGDIFKRSTQLVIDHPFYFLIKSDEAILLAGHVVHV